MDKSRNVVILSIVHHRQNPLDSTENVLAWRLFVAQELLLQEVDTLVGMLFALRFLKLWVRMARSPLYVRFLKKYEYVCYSCTHSPFWLSS
jgi:hypothetical protein